MSLSLARSKVHLPQAILIADLERDEVVSRIDSAISRLGYISNSEYTRSSEDFHSSPKTLDLDQLNC